jgi:glutamyl-tRNA reductase
MALHLHVFGTNFKHAELENVAKLHWCESDTVANFLTELRERFGIAEVFFLQTCNRREFYVYSPNLKFPEYELPGKMLKAVSCVMGHQFDPDHFYHLQDHIALRHLFRVASSLDSMVLGETEIIKQLKDQALAAKRAGNLGRHLTYCVDTALWASKQVRHRTEITKNVISMPSLAFREALNHTQGRSKPRIVFVGAGHFMQTMLPTFSKGRERFDFLFVNRSLPNKLADIYGDEAMSLEEFLTNPTPFDVLISATAAPGHLFTKDWVAQHAANALFLDAALPADIDPDITEVSGVRLIDLAEMEVVLKENRAKREAEIPKADPIFNEAIDRIEAKWLEFELSSYNRQISSHYRETGEKAVSHLLKDLLPNLDESQSQAVREWADNLVGRLTKVPVLGLKSIAREFGPQGIDAYTTGVADRSKCFREAPQKDVSRAC